MTTAAQRLIWLGATIPLLVGVLTLFGWLLGLPGLTNLGLGTETVKANTAVCCLLLALAIALAGRSPAQAGGRMVRALPSLAVVVIAALTGAQYVWGFDVGIDQLLIAEPGVIDRAPGRMAPNTALAFLSGGLGLLLFTVCGPTACGRRALFAGATVVAALAFFSIVGYTANISAGRQWGRAVTMSVPTTLVFAATASALFALIRHHRLLEWHLQRRQTAFLLTGVAGLIAVATLGWEASLRLEETNGRLVQTSQSRFLLSELLSAAQDIENGLRRQLVAGDVGTVERAKARAATVLAELQSILTPAENSGRIAQMEGLIARLAAFEENLMSLQQSGGIVAVLEQITPGEGTRIADEIRGVVQALQAERSNLIAALEIEAAQWRRATGFVLVLGEILALATFAIALGSLNREAGRRVAGETRFRGIFDSTFQFIGLLKPDGTLVEANQTALDFGGLTPADVIGRPFWETHWWQIAPDTAARLRNAIGRAAGGELVRYEVEVQGAQGRRAIIDFSLKPVRDRAGAIVFLVPEGRDITEAKRAKEALAESEARWSFALTGSDLGVWDWNAATNAVFFSERWCTMLGYEPSEISPRLEEWSSRVHPDDLEPVMALIREHFEGRTPIYVSVHRIRCKDGTYRWIMDRGRVISRSADGKPLRVIGTHTDMTAQKSAEEKAGTLQQQLAGILRFSPNLITLIDRDGRYLLVGERAAQALGRESDYIIGRTFHELMPAAVADTFAARIARMNAHPEPFEVEDAVPTPSGERIFHTHLFPLLDAQGRHYATGGIAGDVTEARGALSSVQRALAEREVLLREIHHRVKNNLQIISSLLNLQARQLADPALRLAFEDCRQRVVSMSLIHDQLYRHEDLARIDFSAYVHDLVRLQRTAYGLPASRIAAHIDIAVPPVDVAVAVPCGLIVNELFSNACKHAFPGGRSGQVHIRLHADGGEWELLVSDDGVGSPADQADSSGGLGLQLIGALVRQLRGRLQESAGSDGRTTSIRFPAPPSNPS